MHFEIKKLGAGDIKLAKNLFLFYQIDDGVDKPVIPSDKYLYDILSRETFHVVVAFQNDVVFGGLTAYELDMYKEEMTEIFLYEIAVDPLYRKNGIAKALIEFLKKICVSKGIKEMYVGTEKDNEQAIKLYKTTKCLISESSPVLIQTILYNLN